MSEPTKKKKMSLNQLPDTERLARIVQRAEEHQKSKASSSSAHPEGEGDVSSDMGNDHPGALLPPADWPIERKLVHGKVVAALKTVYDPEIPVDIYELGLIYNIDITADGKVTVTMTLTAPGCPVADSLPREVESKIENIPEVAEATVNLVWDPPWSRDRMSEAAQLHLGLY
jgi:FeS assembly SUF system protein